MRGHLAALYLSPKINWGSVPDWLAGIGAVAALFFLAVALLREIRARRADEARRDAERRDHEARHARRISIAVLRASGLSLELEIANDSDGPIFDVVPAYEGPDVRNPIRIARIPAGEATRASVGSSTLLTTGADVVPVVTFTDVDGLRWRLAAGERPVRELAP
jgi:hypothetical protein